MAIEELGEALAPNDSIFDIVEEEEIVDPLVGGDIVVDEDEENPLAFEIEEPISGSNLATLPDMAINMVGDSMENPEEEIEIVENVPEEDIVEIPEEEDIGSEVMEVPEEFELDYEEPGELVASILETARRFAEYDIESPNSLRRAGALCDRLEKMIIAGVTNDCKEQKLTLAHMRLLDDIEEGILYTRSFLEDAKAGKRKVLAGRIGDFALQNGAYDPFCATIARVLINAQVQGGKKVQDVFDSLKSKYGINDREEFQISQIMLDMGYPVRSLIDGEDMIEQRYA